MKKIILAAPLALAFAVGAQAADPVQHQVTVVATVPTDSFYVVTPVGDNWTSVPQELSWDPVREELSTLRKQFNVKSTIGPISAYLTSPAAISSGGNSIDLQVKVHGVELTTASNIVVPNGAATGGRMVDFELAALAPTSGSYVPGSYQGMVGMMFETAAP
ncbi:fimbrial protein [Pseudomonas sp. LS1212]|uniref:fimbrial protein n=1 Tax=Pseudomonas sp. LS1212 TaxID=2972478 RepID=UPI00215CDE27|nr:fimbrial protein [Pseudomonas sp. LS1212]UVJ43867.1 fimbrial protein [Pseudomonas sp. LS1212]